MAKIKQKKIDNPLPGLEQGNTPIRLWEIAGLGLLLFMMMCMETASVVVEDSAKILLMVVVLGTIVAGVVFRNKLVASIAPMEVAILLWVILGWVSTLYARAPQFALKEFSKLILSCCIFLLFIMVQKAGVRGAQWCASIVVAASTWSAIFSIDKISTRIFSGLFEGMMNAVAAPAFMAESLENGVRINSILGSANVFAGYLGLGVLLSLGLIAQAENRVERNFYRICLLIDSLAFVLAFSMGASGTIAVAFLAYLILEKGDRRPALLIRMVETLALVMLLAFPIFLTSFEGWSGIQVIPLACVVVGAIVFILLDETVGQKLEVILRARPRVTLVAIGAVLLSVVVFVLLAINMTGSVSMATGESLRRSAYPQSGEYILDMESSGGLKVTIESQNQQETMMHTSTVLYSGLADEASFQVPEDSLVVYVNMSATEDIQLDTVNLVGEDDTYSLKLEYTLLPGFIANRLQGLWANENAIQRTVFFQDGMKLFWQSPIYGLGLGAFENGVFSVQEFLYETKYVHNHYIQMMLDMGIIGLVIFVSVMGLALWGLLRARKKRGSEPLLVALLSCLIFMSFHGVVEFIFSCGEYLIPAFGVLGAVALLTEESQLPPTKIKQGILVLALAMAAVFVGMQGINLYCYNAARTSNQSNYLERLETGATWDHYSRTSYWMSYVYSATDSTDQAVVAQATEYAQKLGEQNSNTSSSYVAEFYLSQGEIEKGFDMLEKHVLYTASNSDKWNQAFQIALERLTQENLEEYLPRIEALYEIMQHWQEVYMGSLTLDSQIEEYLCYLLGVA